MSAKKRQNGSEAASKLVSVAIIGSSHVTRLHGFCASSTKANSDRRMDLGDKAVIHWFGRRGGTIENILDQDLTAIQSCAPKICVLVVGGNDLDQGLDPMRVACRLIGLAQVLRNRAGAQQIYILGIIPRPGPRYLTPVKFSEAADACNSDLNLLLGGDQDNKKAYPETHYWRLRRFMSSRMPIHNRDQVHLNDLGNKRLYHNIRHAILDSLKYIRL